MSMLSLIHIFHPILPLDAKEVSTLDLRISVTLYLYGDLRADVSLEGERNLCLLYTSVRFAIGALQQGGAVVEPVCDLALGE